MKSMIIGLLLLSFVLVLGNVASAQDVTVDGNLLMQDSTDTVGNVLKGPDLFIHNFGTNNTFVGKNAGNLTMTGFGNTGTGTLALQNNTEGANNTATGGGALLSNTTGNSNTASGFNALVRNTTGNSNTASGASALFSNTTGDNNTATGFGALTSNTTGFENTAIGFGALASNTTISGVPGFENTAIGVRALLSNTTGRLNTASGSQALQSNTTGRDNTAIGRDALFSNNIGGSNTAIGSSALSSNTTGGGNTAIGSGALFFNTTGRNNTAIGEGADAGSDLTNATAIGAGAVVNASDKIRLGSPEVTVVEGPPYNVVSDRNQKENFQSVDGEEVLRKIGDLSLTSWNYIGHDPKQFRHYGPVAQEFFAAFGNDGIGTIGTPTTITYTDIAGILMIAVQALEKRTVEQRKEIDTLRNENSDLKARVEALERLVRTAQTAMRESAE